MAITPEQATQILQLSVAMFDAAPGVVLGEQMASIVNSGKSIEELAAIMDDTTYFTEGMGYYPNLMTDQQFAAKFLDTLVGDLVSADNKAWVVDELVNWIQASSRGEAIWYAAEILASVPETDPNFGAAAAQFNNKVEVATYYTLDHWGQDTELSALQAVIANVTDDDATVAAAIAVIDGDEPGEVPPFFLTAGQDTLIGGGADDLFIADVVQVAGAQANSLATGDYLDGGDGHDTLEAQLTEGVFLGGGNMPVTPRTSSVETVLVDALNARMGINYDTTGTVVLDGLLDKLNQLIDDAVELFVGSMFGNDDELFSPWDIPVLIDYVHDLLSWDGPSIYETDVYLNAENMNGVETIGSWHSEANLVIQNMTTKYSDGTGARALNEMTVVMGYTGSRDHIWAESDLSVYFDPDYLIPTPISTQPTIDLLVMNEDAYDETYDAGLGVGTLPLAGVFLRQLHFTLNGVEYDLDQYIDEDPDGAGEEIQTYDELLAAIQAAIVELKADNPGDAALQSLQAVMGDNFLTDISPILNEQRVGQTIRLTVDGITNDQLNTLTIESQQLEVARAAASEYENNNRYERAIDDPSVQDEELAINVDLEKAGLLGDGGELIIGSMYKDGTNTWNDDIIRPGIDKFIVTVYGDEDKPSSLAGLRSTNNALRVVTVATDANQTESFADLTIGNSNTDGWLRDIPTMGNQAALKDVRIFDASEFKGDLTLYAAITDEAAAKYMDLMDEQDDPNGDDASFEYTGGTGDDYFNIALDQDNFPYDGTVTREDFVLTVDGNAGDDEIVVSIIEEYADVANAWTFGGFFDPLTRIIPEEGQEPPVEEGNDALLGVFPLPFAFARNWYDNQSLTDDGDYNINIYGGDGEDIIRTPGSGDANIFGGNNDDAIYVDNTGDKAVWVFNVEEGLPWFRENIDNLQSDANNSYQLYKGSMQITFKGFESCACPIEQSLIPSGEGWTTDLHINQTIKKIINNDDVLSDLLVAKDGPGNTIIIESKIDGAMVNDDLDIEFFAPDSLTTVEVSTLNSWYGSNLNAGQLLNIFNGSVDAIEAKGDYADGLARYGFGPWFGEEISGFWSMHTSDNVVTAGDDDAWWCGLDECGGDVIVLGTGFFSNDTVRYEGDIDGTDFGPNGYDSIVHFNTWLFGDYSIWLPNGPANVNETFIATFDDLKDGDLIQDYDFTLDGVTYTVSIPDGADGITIAGLVALAVNVGGGNWLADWVVGTDEVVFNYNGDDGAFASDADVLAAFTGGTPPILNVTISDYIDGNPIIVPIAEQAWAVLDLNGTLVTEAGTFNFDGASVDYEVGDTAVELAHKLALGDFATWQVLNPGDGTVIFLAKDLGEQNIIAINTELNTDNPDLGDDGINAVWTDWSYGADADTEGLVTYREVSFEGALGDFLDFSWYTADAGNGYDVGSVYVDGVLKAETPGGGDQLIHMVEDITNPGEYWIYLYEAGNEIGVIGVADFGVNMDDNPYDPMHYLTAENFILA